MERRHKLETEVDIFMCSCNLIFSADESSYHQAYFAGNDTEVQIASITIRQLVKSRTWTQTALRRGRIY